MNDLPKSYDPKNVEKKWYGYWEQNHLFAANPQSSKPPFTIIMPPPNVTGHLHMGHALVQTLQDILIRLKRMQGFETLWMPGTDHAGISTQTVVEKHLMKTFGKRKQDYDREEFIQKIWDWKEEKQCRILNQIQKLGCSCDWSRLRFTMDKKSNLAVRTVFKKMFDDGLIYRGDYLVNWDPATQTALADDEVEYEERKSHLWYIRYPIKESNDFLIIATTRPETMFGDTALAVSPKDPRFVSLIGKTVTVPIVNREIPIIADHTVDPKFGTGVVKITPAHDHNDYDVGLRHQLPIINILTPDGKINKNGQEFEGLFVFEARENLIKKLEELDFLEKTEPHIHRVGISYRSKAVIEPYLSKQWFVKITAFKDELIRVVKNKEVQLIPKSFEKIYFHWINNLRDWCISRQIYWGHRIPVWYHINEPEKIICYAGDGIPKEVEKDPDHWIQDEDVLDTWFSSALWPFSTLGWPENTEDLNKFYPTSVLITGHDILFFWVARMILMGKYVMHKVPFHQTFLHGLIYSKSYWKKEKDGSTTYLSLEEKANYDLGEPIPENIDSKWEKMSKSKNNVIDPIEIIDLYGTDAMRMALSSSVTFAKQIDLDRRRFDEFKNFANKIWNGARFVFQNIQGDDPLTKEQFESGLNISLFNLEDQWIFTKFNQTIEKILVYFDEFHFDQAANLSYDFFWNDFCSNYLELAKPYLFLKSGNAALRKNKQKILVILLGLTMRMIHPIAPYITEEIFSILKTFYKGSSTVDIYTEDALIALNSEACMTAPYPKKFENVNPEVLNHFHDMQNLVYTIRNIRGEMGLPLAQKTDLYIKGENLNFIKENKEMIFSLTKTEKIHFTQSLPSSFGSTDRIHDLILFIPLPEDLKEKEKERIQKEIEKLKKTIHSSKSKLSNKNFLEKAPLEVVKKMQNTLENSEKKFEELQKKIQQL